MGDPLVELGVGVVFPAELVKHLPVLQEQHPSGAAGRLDGVGHHQNGLALLMQSGKQIQQLVGGLGVQRTGGFVGQQDTGMGDHGAGHGGTLLLAAGHLVPVLEKLGSAVPLQAQQIVIPMLAVGLCFELQPETVQLVADFVLSTITVKGQLSGILKTVLCHFQENYITVLEAYDPADHGVTPYTRREEL